MEAISIMMSAENGSKQNQETALQSEAVCYHLGPQAVTACPKLSPYIRFGRGWASDNYFVIGRGKAAGVGGRAAIRSLGIQGTWYLETESPPVTLRIRGQIAQPYILRPATAQQLDEDGRPDLGQRTGSRPVRLFLGLGCLA